jgi:hypothetical protein
MESQGITEASLRQASSTQETPILPKGSPRQRKEEPKLEMEDGGLT